MAGFKLSTDPSAQPPPSLIHSSQLPIACHLQGIELLPYHLLGRNKWEALGLAYPLEGVQTPPLDQVLQVVQQLEGTGLNVICDAKRQAAAHADQATGHQHGHHAQ
jgi:hypothetical protein